MDVLILQGAVVALFGVVTALAKVAWSERGSRVNACEKKVAYYEEQVIPTITRVIDASEKGQVSLAVLTRVVEESLKDARSRG